MSLKKTQTKKEVLPHLENESLLKLTATVVFGLTMLLSSFGNTAQAQGCSGFDAGFTVEHPAYLVEDSVVGAEFKDTSLGAWQHDHTWYMGDGTVVTDSTYLVRHQYASYGQYQVCHVVESSNCYDSTCKMVNISCDTTINIEVRQYFPNNLKYDFKAGYRVDSYVWKLGDNTKKTGAGLSYNDVVHAYSKPGIYNVTLKAFKGPNNNCVATEQRTINACDAVAGFQVQGNGFQRTFNPDTTANSYLWDFGDGTTSTKVNPTHTYSDTGTYRVTLIANGSNCADTQTKQVTIKCKADAGFTISSLDNERDFDANTQANSASSTYHWDFGDGSTATSAYVSHSYSRKDTYDVQLVVKDGPGCADTNTRQVVIGNSNTIDGRIALQQGPSNTIDSFLVKLYHYDSCKGVYNQIRSKTVLPDYIGDSADYDFDSLPPGKFHVKADPSRDSNLSGKYVATYHQKATNWSNADSIVMSGLGKYTDRNDITLQKATNTSGSGNITGYVGGSKANCNNKRRPEDGPLANVPVLLLNENREPVARTTTDEDGNYQFNDLALNTYYVRVDLPGYQAKAEEVTLSSDQPNEEADFEVSNEQVTPQKSTGLAEEAASKATVELYPVPSRSQVTVTISDAEAEQLALRVTNMQGQLMAQQRLSASGQQQDIQLDVSDWQSGAYILQLRDQHGQVKEARKLMVR